MLKTADEYLIATEVVDWNHPSVRQLATEIAKGCHNKTDLAEHCYQWVRDNIRHSSDYELNPVSCSASDVLEHRTGYCYAKSHLLAALLRANQIPVGFCYQRLAIDGVGSPYCLHGLNAIYLAEHGWYRVDARGNRADIQADFRPPNECLAFETALDGERDFPEILAEPLPLVVDALRAHSTWDTLLENLPDFTGDQLRPGNSIHFAR